MLILRKPRASQPQGATRANPLYTPALLFNWSESLSPRNVVEGVYSRASGATWSRGSNPTSQPAGVGVGIKTSTNTSTYGRRFFTTNPVAASDIAASSPFWMAAAFTHSPFVNLSSGVNVICGFEGFGNLSAYINGSNVLTVECRGVALTGPTLVSGQTYHILFGRNAAGSCWLWINGALFVSGSGATAASTSTTEFRAHCSGDYQSNFRAYEGSIGLFAMGFDDPQSFGVNLSANLWQLFAPRSIFIPVSAGGGATNYPVTATEAASAADSCSAIVGYATTATETGAAADTSSAVTAKSGTVTEPATAADTVTSSAAVAVSITETASAADTVSAAAAGDYAVTATEAASAADTASAVAAFLASLTEPATATDTVSGAGAGAYTGTIDEAAAATDLASAVYAYLAGVSEVASAADLQSALAALSASITEAAAATDTVSVAGSAEPLTNAEMQQLYAWVQQLVNERHLTLPQFLALK